MRHALCSKKHLLPGFRRQTVQILLAAFLYHIIAQLPAAQPRVAKGTGRRAAVVGVTAVVGVFTTAVVGVITNNRSHPICQTPFLFLNLHTEIIYPNT